MDIETILQEQKGNKDKKRDAEKALDDLQKQMMEEVKMIVKKNFDYDIPIAKVDDAGITTTGAVSEGNQLPALVKVYCNYRTVNCLWKDQSVTFSYVYNNKKGYCRIASGKEVVLNGK